MAKFKIVNSEETIETFDKNRIEKLKGYPDKFHIIEEVKIENKKEEVKENKKSK